MLPFQVPEVTVPSMELPPEMVRPLLEESPTVESPPLKVEVAVEVALKRDAETKPPVTRLPRMSTSPAKVEVAVVLVARYAAAVGVEVATKLPKLLSAVSISAHSPESVIVEEVAMRFPVVRVPETMASPCTESVFEGVEVPMPKYPVSTMNRAASVGARSGAWKIRLPAPPPSFGVGTGDGRRWRWRSCPWF